MIIQDCRICGEPFERRYGNELICGDLLCHQIAVLRGKRRSADNRLAPLEAQLAERKGVTDER